MTNAERTDDAATELRLLFSPILVGSREVKNRIVSTAHATGMAAGGILNERYVRYHERKAAGGTGLVMTFGSASVYEKSAAAYGSVSLWDKENDPYLRDFAERVHAHGAVIMSQATHMGRRANSAESGQPIQAPSAVPEPVHREIPQALRIDEIREIVKAFAAAAARLDDCGWDGMEITSFGGHLIEQFWSPTVNQRTDGYGGDLEGRMRFSVEVVEAVSEAVSADFIVGFRMTGDPLTDVVGLDRDDMLEIAVALDNLGRIDLFNISGGTGATLSSQAGTVPPDYFRRGCYNHLAARMKEHLSVPVIAAGRNLDPPQAEETLTAGDCDLVAMTRAIIADPDLARHARAGELSRIRPCIAINEGCMGRVYDGLSIACSVNPGIADNSLSELAPREKQRRVVVIGGGPAGMEAARVAAERGHEVILFERTERLGGQVLPASSAPDRPHLGLHAAWLERELGRLGVDVRLGFEASVDSVLAERPEAVILATGARTVIPPEAEGVEARCVTDVDLLEGKIDIQGSRVLVYDAGALRGGYAAIAAAEVGATAVELATYLPTVVEDLDVTNKPGMYRRLARNGVVCSPNQVLVGQRNGSLVLRDEWSEEEWLVQGADLIVFAGYRIAESKLRDLISDVVPELETHLVGDSAAPRLLRDAVADGVRVGNSV